MAKKFYLTTTLPYVNADPHLGFAMEIVRADVLARYHRLLGEEIIFNTGTDEHGQKVYQKAIEQKQTPQDYCGSHAQKYQALKKLLNLSFTHFIRTTQKDHVEAAQEFWRRCQKKGDIYKDHYQIKYCVGCELEKTDSELINNRCPVHPDKEIEIRDEENYFFRFSKYQKALLELYERHPRFVVPQFRFEEIKKFVANGLKDFSISRLKAKMPWGVEVPNDPEQVMYVWFDALINYISTLGWPKKGSDYETFWPGIQLAGKDNLRQQSAMWQAMLISAGLPNSKQIYVEGFITSEGQKMSKSTGNVIDPFELVKKYGVDPVRYYLLREIPAYDDGNFSDRRFCELYTADLANGLGNLVSRVAKLAENSAENFAPATANFYPEIKNYLDAFAFDQALILINQKTNHLDSLINQTKPWELTGTKLKAVLTPLVTEIRQLAFNLQPFLPTTTEKIASQFAGPKISSASPLFPRLN
ncbi:MAG: methionine--tRNA ligase [Candidatus Shapirobacteria bacterium]